MKMCTYKSQMERNSKLSILLQSFYHIAISGGFSKASSVLRQSRSTLTNHIYELETIYSIRLINRTTRSFSLSQEGEQLLKKCIELNRVLEDSHEILTEFSEKNSGNLCIKIPAVLDNKDFHLLLSKYKTMHPEVVLNVIVSNNFVDLVTDKIDISLHIGDIKDSSYICRTVASFNTYVVGSPRFWEKHDKPTHPSMLKALPCLNYRHCKTGNKWTFIEDGYKFLVDIGPSHICDSDEMLLSFALDGSGVTTLLDFTCHDLITTGKLETCLDGWTHSVKLNAMFQKRENTPTRVRNFLDALIDLAPLLKP
jgi:LysR family transcriptional regulator for bpeEF and oprC